MEFNILGPLEVLREGERLTLGGLRQRAVLGFLLLHANTPVTTRRLSDALWGENEPATARKVLQNAVYGLRRALSSRDRPAGPASSASSASPSNPANPDDPAKSSLLAHRQGYVLHVPAGHIDLSRHTRLVACGRDQLAAGAWQKASRSLSDALGLWRGEALADLVETGIAWPELTVVGEERWEVLADRVTADLMLGRHAQVAAELGVVTAAEPTRERLCAQLMLALYQRDRQADALELCRRTRSAIFEEFGARPGRELRELERAVLNQSPELSAPTAAARLFGRPGGGSGGAARPDAGAGSRGRLPARTVPGADAPVVRPQFV